MDSISGKYVKVAHYEDGTEEQFQLDEQEQQKMRELLQNTSIPNIS